MPKPSLDVHAAVGAQPSIPYLAERGAKRVQSKPPRWSRLITVHPCFIDGVRTLVHARGLEKSRELFVRLEAYARRHGFRLLADRRRRELTCRDERRRLAPLLLFAAGLLGQGVHAAVGERPTAPGGREYLIEAGKRFVSKPHGTTELILGIAEEVKAKGEKHRVRTRGIHMPAEYTDSFVDRYDYTLPTGCGEATFSYYEGEGFGALGYHAGRGTVILDVLAGGGPFSAPRLWGPYDQVLNANIRMDLMMGDGLKDGMGLLQASYKIGLVPVMRKATKNYYGELYARAVLDAANCVMPNSPAVIQAAAQNTMAAVEE